MTTQATIDMAVLVKVPIAVPDTTDLGSVQVLMGLIDAAFDEAVRNATANLGEGTEVVRLAGTEVLGVNVWVERADEDAAAERLLG